jgi:hypothetical protein
VPLLARRSLAIALVEAADVLAAIRVSLTEAHQAEEGRKPRRPAAEPRLVLGSLACAAQLLVSACGPGVPAGLAAGRELSEAEAPIGSEPPVAAPATAETPAGAYLGYSRAVERATDAAELVPYFAEHRRRELDAAKARGADLLANMRASALAHAEVAAQRVDGDTATLEVRGVKRNPRTGRMVRISGTVELVREGPVWRISRMRHHRDPAAVPTVRAMPGH